MERVLFVSASDPDDVGAWSGSTHRIFHALKGRFPVVENLVVKGMPPPFVERLYGSIQSRLMGKHSYYELRHSVTRHYARQIQEALNRTSYDAVFAPGTIYFAALKTEVPLFATADACLGGLVGYYPEFTNLTARDLAQGSEIERQAAAACRKVFYTSDWARQTAVDSGIIAPDRAVVVPFGANWKESPSLDRVKEFVLGRRSDGVDVLLVGVDWKRKGGQIAFDAVAEMNRKGADAVLHVVGCPVPDGLMDAPFLRHYGFLRKAKDDELAKLQELFARSHFLLLPTRAECYGVVFAEAGEYGLPALATRTGGVPTAVRDGINGYTLDYDASPTAYAEKALEIIGDRDRYVALCLSAKELVARELNWGACADGWKREMEAG